MVMLRKRYFWNNLIIKVGRVNQHEPGELYSKLFPSSTLMACSRTYMPLRI